jgi:hypothetical protein
MSKTSSNGFRTLKFLQYWGLFFSFFAIDYQIQKLNHDWLGENYNPKPAKDEISGYSYKNGKMNDYSANYRYVLKHRILAKRKTLTNDLLLINEVLDKLQFL